MAGSSVESLQNLNSAAVLKFHVGGILLGDSSAELPDPASIVAADGTLTIPDGYLSCGLITTDGITKSRSMSSDDTKAWQTLATVRSDVTDDEVSFKVKFQEYNLVNFALRQGLTLADAAPLFTNAGIAAKRDTSGRQPQRRGIVIARDTKYGITMAQIVPNITLADEGDESIGRSTELQLDATFKCLYDSVFGSDFSTSMNGPGLAALVAGAAGVSSSNTAAPTTP